MQQIYTIPVNEAFDLCREKPENGCPLCVLYKRLQRDELDIILGASMMEPDIRIKTNELGFCSSHFSMMLKRKRMLGMGLILESHLSEVEKKLNAKKPPVIGPAGADTDTLQRLNASCYVCERINKNLDAMTATVIYLFESERSFREKFTAQRLFCLPHYTALCGASSRMSRKYAAAFTKAAAELCRNHLKALREDVNHFTRMFDYRNSSDENADWGNSRDSIERSVAWLCGREP